MVRLVAVCAVVVLSAGAGRAQDAGWRGELPGALAEAKRTGRPVLVEFTATWCHACKLLEAQAFKDPGVKRALAAGFVPVKLDADQNEALTAKYGVRSLPTLLVLGPDGAELGRRTGSAGAADITRWLAPFKASAPAPAAAPVPPPRMPPLPTPPAPPADPWAAVHADLSRALDRPAAAPAAPAPPLPR